MIAIKIDVQKISKLHLFKGTKGTYLDITLKDNKEGRDERGNDGFVVQDLGKEARQAGERGPIIGNWRHVGQPQKPQQRPAPQKPKQTAPDPDLDEVEEEDVPFNFVA